MGRLAHADPSGSGLDAGINEPVSDHPAGSNHLYSLEVDHREALALLSALELSPFDDEVLTQKLLNLVYSPKTRTHSRRPRARVRDFSHHRK